MPAGAKPGERRGGRAKGTPNRITIVKAAKIARDRKQQNRQTAVEVLSEAMNYFRGMAARYQPRADNPKGDEPKFIKYLGLAAGIAKDLAPYETPKMQSTMLTGPGVDGAHTVKVQVEYVG